MQLAAKIRKDFLKVDRFWRTFLSNHSKYNPVPLDQLAPIESPAPIKLDNSNYLKYNRIVPINQQSNDIGVQTLDIKIFNEKLDSTTNGFAFPDLNGTISDLPIEEVKIESYEVYDSVKCEFDDSNYGASNDYPIDSDGETMDEDSKDPTVKISDDQDDVNDNSVKRRSGKKYPKKRNIHGTDPVKGDNRLFKCFEPGCSQGKYCRLFILIFDLLIDYQNRSGSGGRYSLFEKKKSKNVRVR